MPKMPDDPTPEQKADRTPLENADTPTRRYAFPPLIPAHERISTRFRQECMHPNLDLASLSIWRSNRPLFSYHQPGDTSFLRSTRLRSAVFVPFSGRSNLQRRTDQLR